MTASIISSYLKKIILRQILYLIQCIYDFKSKYNYLPGLIQLPRSFHFQGPLASSCCPGLQHLASPPTLTSLPSHSWRTAVWYSIHTFRTAGMRYEHWMFLNVLSLMHIMFMLLKSWRAFDALAPVNKMLPATSKVPCRKSWSQWLATPTVLHSTSFTRNQHAHKCSQSALNNNSTLFMATPTWWQQLL